MKLTNVTDDLQLLVQILPESIQKGLKRHSDLELLTEIVLDFGHVPEFRFTNATYRMTRHAPLTHQAIDAVCKKVGHFNTDNRAGIERTLHRISAIRNREGRIIGLTCRVGRAVEGTIEPLRDMIESGKNTLFLGPPGIGKTTKLREAARILSLNLKRRVIVVDTSNEIAGDGDIAHPGIGLARRMQVPSPDRQHAVMIEAVENHMPEVIIVDEIGTEEEAKAARTIAERGVQLIATAHGHSLENLIKNPTLSDLFGGIQSVILGDEEAKFRGTQKTVLERRTYPTFHVLIEIRQQDSFAIYHNLAEAVDLFLRTTPIHPELRTRQNGKIVVEATPKELPRPFVTGDIQEKVFPFGINVGQLNSVIRLLGLPVVVTQSIGQADFMLTIRSEIKSKSKITQILQGHQIPVHVIKQNSSTQIMKFFKSHFNIDDTDDALAQEVLDEIKQLCKSVKNQNRSMDAPPQSAYYRRLQHHYVEEIGLKSISVGEEPNRRVRVYPPSPQ